MTLNAFSVQVASRGAAVVLCVGGELDLTTTPDLQKSIALAMMSRPRLLVIDLTAVTFLASAGMVALAVAHQLAADHTAVRVVAAGRECGRPIRLTGLDSMLAVHPTLDDALR
ncbi:MAG: STAS domain-containing protein [Pseudonocardiaceae bacterium]|nr:STAS domain-containing protein [Pseudonocardiaceae bacterium]